MFNTHFVRAMALVLLAALLCTGCEKIGVADGGARPAGWKPGSGRPPAVGGNGAAEGATVASTQHIG